MKPLTHLKYLAAIICILLCCGSVKSQGLFLNGFYEQTIVSPKLGGSVGMEFWNLSEVGVFYQAKAFHSNQEYITDENVENQFFGLYASYPLYSDEFLNLKISGRAGLANMEKWRITPSANATLFPTNPLAVGTAISVFDAKPTLMIYLRVRLDRTKRSICRAVYY